MSLFPQHDAAVAWALSHVGEHEDPMGSNTGAFVRDCQAATWLGGTRWPWCVAFALRACKAALKAAYLKRFPYRGAGAYAWLEWARKVGWACTSQEAIPGDFVVFNIGSGHMGMLARPVAETRPSVHTIDGNVGDRVAREARPLTAVRGFVHWPETAVAKGREPKPDPRDKPLPPVKPPVFEVVTSASGHTKVVYVSGSRAISRKLGALLNRYGGITIRRRKRLKGHG